MPRLPSSRRFWLAGTARLAIAEQLRAEGYIARAVAVLDRAGLRVWENVAGHIAIDTATVVETM